MLATSQHLNQSLNALQKRADHLTDLLQSDEFHIVNDCTFSPQEELFIKTLTSLKFMIQFDELKFLKNLLPLKDDGMKADNQNENEGQE